MTRKIKMVTLFLILVVASMGLYIYLELYNKPHVDVSRSSPNISVDSSIILKDFEDSEADANTKYLEKIVQVTGVISELNTNKGKTIVTISGQNTFGSIMCHLSPEENIKADHLKEGQNITIKGICTGYLMDVILVKCVIIN